MSNATSVFAQPAMSSSCQKRKVANLNLTKCKDFIAMMKMIVQAKKINQKRDNYRHLDFAEEVLSNKRSVKRAIYLKLPLTKFNKTNRTMILTLVSKCSRSIMTLML